MGTGKKLADSREKGTVLFSLSQKYKREKIIIIEPSPFPKEIQGEN